MEKASILLIDDDRKLADLLKGYLAGFKMAVTPAFSSDDGLRMLKRHPPDLVILDVMLPGKDGFETCKEIRRSTSVPIIMLTARGELSDRVVGLELGADDYITKPFSTRELVARVKTVLRRCQPPLSPGLIVAGALEIDTAAMTLRVRGELTVTTATEFRLLHYLAQHPSRVFTRDQLLDAVWRDTTFVSPRSVDVYVRKLREKIEKNPERPEYLKTVRGAGYRFELPREEAQ